MADGRPLLEPGDRMPAFQVRSRVNPRFNFDTLGGRWLVLGLIGSAGAVPIAPALHAMTSSDWFDDDRASLFLISVDPSDETTGRLQDRIPGLRIFWDTDRAVSRQLGAANEDGQGYRPHWLVIDPSLTVRKVVPLRPDSSCAAEVLEWLGQAPPVERYLGFAPPAPILILPDIFEPAFCDHLIGLYKANGAELSGVMRDQGGQTVGIQDAGFKVRRDYFVEDEALKTALQARILRKVVPQIERVHFFRCTRMERYLVGGYPAEEGGHFSPHRDNTTLGTAHRRFAVSINLNDDFEGGEVSFPEYGPKSYKAPKGTAIIFSCSLLHAVGQVTKGTRYAFLPFLYDDAAARIREANAAKVPNAANYRA